MVTLYPLYCHACPAPLLAPGLPRQTLNLQVKAEERGYMALDEPERTLSVLYSPRYIQRRTRPEIYLISHVYTLGFPLVT